MIGIIMGSTSDLPVMQQAIDVLDELGLAYEVDIVSAHRTPEKLMDYGQNAHKRGIKAIIAGAGGAAHLAGVIAAESTLPVIGVPINSTPLNGLDSLLSTAQMPGGIPVATVSIGKWGAKNAGLLAVQILALSNDKIASQLVKYRKQQAKAVEQKSKKLETPHAANFKG